MKKLQDEWSKDKEIKRMKNKNKKYERFLLIILKKLFIIYDIWQFTM